MIDLKPEQAKQAEANFENAKSNSKVVCSQMSV